MSLYVKYWFLFNLFAFGVSSLTLGIVQNRLRRRWGYFRWHRHFHWRELSRTQRILIWPGLIAFFLTILYGIVGNLLGWK
jgi:hypothetical protein